MQRRARSVCRCRARRRFRRWFPGRSRVRRAHRWVFSASSLPFCPGLAGEPHLGVLDVSSGDLVDDDHVGFGGEPASGGGSLETPSHRAPLGDGDPLRRVRLSRRAWVRGHAMRYSGLLLCSPAGRRSSRGRTRRRGQLPRRPCLAARSGTPFGARALRAHRRFGVRSSRCGEPFVSLGAGPGTIITSWRYLRRQDPPSATYAFSLAGSIRRGCRRGRSRRHAAAPCHPR